MAPRGSQPLWPRSALVLVTAGFAGLVVLLWSHGLGAAGVAAGLASATLLVGGLGLIARRLHALIASLAKAATTDPLTGLLNRRGFQHAFDRELDRARRDGVPLAVIIADLDDFKQLNDRLGHMGGDMALERAAGAISRTTRTMDTAARIGGEEFAILAPEAVSLDAFSLAERIRTRIETTFEGTAASVTISAGVASFPGDGSSAEELFHAADKAMYKAKALGKNRSVLAQPEPSGDGPAVAPPLPELATTEPS